jgi:hypothetical protein
MLYSIFALRDACHCIKNPPKTNKPGKKPKPLRALVFYFTSRMESTGERMRRKG